MSNIFSHIRRTVTTDEVIEVIEPDFSARTQTPDFGTFFGGAEYDGTDFDDDYLSDEEGDYDDEDDNEDDDVVTTESINVPAKVEAPFPLTVVLTVDGQNGGTFHYDTVEALSRAVTSTKSYYQGHDTVTLTITKG